MAITVPVIFTPIQDAEVSYKRSVNEETIRKMVQNVNMQGKFAPIGTIGCVQLNQTGVQAVNSDIYMFCNGDEITNPNSPLRSVGLIQRFAPDLRGCYVRGAPSASSNGMGGAASVNLRHEHGGNTGITGGSIVGEEGDEKTARVAHSHKITGDLPPAEPLDPYHQVLAFYIKIT